MFYCRLSGEWGDLADPADASWLAPAVLALEARQ